MDEFEHHKPWPKGIHSKTLFKKNDFRVVLICVEAAARIEEHHADGTSSVQVLKGNIHYKIERIEFVESERTVGLGQGGKNEDDEYFDLLPNI